MIGRLAGAPDDEVWTRSRRLIKDLASALEPSRGGGWGDRYVTRLGNGVYRPFVQRWQGEKDICDRSQLGEREQSIRCTKLDKNLWTDSQLAERMFDLLVADQVIRHPTKRQVGDITTEERWSETKFVPLPTKRLFGVNEAERDTWVSARLLLLTDLNASLRLRR